VEELLALVRLEGLGGRGPTQLSGGQIQRAALARALAPEPTVLLLDEPLSALDLKLRQHMQLELRSIQRTLGATFVYVTHDQTEALVMSDRIAVMNAGRLLQVGTPREIYTRPTSTFASDFIGETNLVAGTVTEAADRGVVIATPGGLRFRGRSDVAVAVGAHATLSVRPEAVRVARWPTAPAPVPEDALRATVREIVYLGSRVRVEAEAEGGTVLWADLRDEEAHGLAEGTEVALTWSPGAARVLPGDPPAQVEETPGELDLLA
jgi:ABC-type Fe3+/spermidine/putrescine transport system ATPase subunit